jgi:lysophospholipid acyltransferase (LPLAT)-like uncharacterized protein
MVDKDAISRAIEKHPKPWTLTVDADGWVQVKDADGYQFINRPPVATDMWQLIVAAVNAFDPQRDAALTALVEAGRKKRLEQRLMDDLVSKTIRGEGVSIETLQTQEYRNADAYLDLRQALENFLDIALAPNTPQGGA